MMVKHAANSLCFYILSQLCYFLFILLPPDHIPFRDFWDVKIFPQCVHLWGEGGKTCTSCVSTFSLSGLSDPSWYAPVFLLMRGLPARKLTLRQKPPKWALAARLLLSVIGSAVAVFPCPQSDNQGSDSARFGQECLVGLNVRRRTARMQAVLLITPDLSELRNKSWLDFYLQHWYCTWVYQIIYRSILIISSCSLGSC